MSFVITDSGNSGSGQHVDERHRRPVVEAVPFQVFRRSRLYGVTAALAVVAAAALALAATLGDVPWMWAPVVVLLALGALALPGVSGGATPIFVADEYGVRMHVREIWIGLLWREIDEVVVEPGNGRRDAHIRITSKDARHTYLTPVGFTTSVSVADAEVELARRRAAAAY